MRTVALESTLLTEACSTLEKSPLFSHLPREQLQEVVSRTQCVELEPGETIMQAGESSDSLFIMLAGAVSVRMSGPRSDQVVEIARLHPPDTVGEMGLLLEQPRSATVVAVERVRALRFSSDAFTALFMTMPNFGRAMCQALADRLQRSQNNVPMSERGDDPDAPSPSVFRLLPVDYVQRHRILPLEQIDQKLIVGFVDDPTPEILANLYRLLPTLEIRPVRIGKQDFDRYLRSQAGVEAWVAPERTMGEGADYSSPSPRLDALLGRMVAEGATDLHLSAGQRPYWRIEGEVHALLDTALLGEQDVYDMLGPIMGENQQARFDRQHDEDFGYSLPGVARFRINMFRDLRGPSAVLRHIPSQIPALEQLGLPTPALKFCEHTKGLVLVTGLGSSGRTTTLASMIDHINRHRRAHIITIEDPVEFIHEGKLGLVNHREVGSHCESFSRGIKAALREDPDVLLLGEIPDLETLKLALEAVHDGHLVFAALSTHTALGAIEHLTSMYPPDQRRDAQMLLAAHLRGIVAQALCRRIEGGRVAAFEVLSMHEALATSLREGRTSQLATLMATGGAFGNILLNEALVRMVREQRIGADEALAKAVDKQDLATRLGRSSAKRLKDELRSTRIISGKNR